MAGTPLPGLSCFRMQHLAVPKPLWRGRLHQAAFFASIPAGFALVALARGAEARLAAGVFAVTLSGLFGVSAAYHLGRWSDRTHRLMKRLDHSMIFVFIAGTYTPVTLLALRPAWGITLLLLAWSGATVGVLITVLRLDHWHRVGFALYLVLGWLAVFAGPQLVHALSSVELVLLVTGGIMYTIGAVVLARKRPDPHPVVFGYHEIWHTFTLAASACHFTLILLLVHA
jgi:hemolysin III